MSKTFRPYDPEQMLLMPVALQDWLPIEHLAYFISDFRKDHLEALSGLFVRVFELCQRAGQQAEPRACKTDHGCQQLLAPQQPQISITETGS